MPTTENEKSFQDYYHNKGKFEMFKGDEIPDSVVVFDT